MANEGEERLLTMYADVHYYFSEPSAHPASHRMDKESYVYLYKDSSRKRARLEVANHAGTPDQDAFTGYLDSSKVINSNRQPALVTVIVDGVKSSGPSPTAGEYHWRLPSTNPRDEGNYLFKLHTLDIYFWTADDARVFVQHVASILRPEQLQVEAPPTSAQRSDHTSPVVQQLENVAISDPAYHNGQTRNSRPMSTDNRPQQSSPQPHKSEESKAAETYTPLAYNPAAPPAPEKIAHREKTPPPPEVEPGSGLSAAAAAVYGHPGQAGSVPPPSSGPGSYQPSPSPYNPASSPHSGYQPSPVPSHGPGLSSPPGNISTTGDPNAHLYGRPSTDSGAYGSPSQQQPHAPIPHLQPQYADYLGSRPQQQTAAPVGGYSNYDYSQSHQHQQQAGHHQAPYYGSGTGDHALHSQVYRPTEDENYHGKPPAAGPGQQSGKWEAKAEKVEKSFNRLLRKAEKKIG